MPGVFGSRPQQQLPQQSISVDAADQVRAKMDASAAASGYGPRNLPVMAPLPTRHGSAPDVIAAIVPAAHKPQVMSYSIPRTMPGIPEASTSASSLPVGKATLQPRTDSRSAVSINNVVMMEPFAPLPPQPAAAVPRVQPQQQDFTPTMHYSNLPAAASVYSQSPTTGDSYVKKAASKIIARLGFGSNSSATSSSSSTSSSVKTSVAHPNSQIQSARGTASGHGSASSSSAALPAHKAQVRSGQLPNPLVPYDSGKDIVAAAPAPKKVEKLTPEQKQEKALRERERRLHEVLSVLEGRKRLPEGMQHLQFANFLGDGTYGFVVTARDPRRGGVECAVKFIFKDKIPSTAWTWSNKLNSLVPTEIYYLSDLDHPNLIKLLDYFTDDLYVIAVTELHGTSWEAENPVLRALAPVGFRTVPRAPRAPDEQGKGDLNTLSSLSAKQREMLRPRVSCDLFECIDAHDWFPEDIVRKIFRQIVDVVAYLHVQGIVHRDLKDENICINERYEIKLIDFGSAARIPGPADPLFDKFLGTMDFAAPEIIEGYKYRGPEVEVFALGVLLYILVFRQTPFKSQQDTVNVIYRKPKELADFYVGAYELYDLLDKMLKRDHNARIPVTQILEHPWMRMEARY